MRIALRHSRTNSRKRKTSVRHATRRSTRVVSCALISVHNSLSVQQSASNWQNENTLQDEYVLCVLNTWPQVILTCYCGRRLNSVAYLACESINYKSVLSVPIVTLSYKKHRWANTAFGLVRTSVSSVPESASKSSRKVWKCVHIVRKTWPERKSNLSWHRLVTSALSKTSARGNALNITRALRPQGQLIHQKNVKFAQIGASQNSYNWNMVSMTRS